MNDTVRVTPYRLTYEIEGEKYLSYFESLNKLMYAACELRAFDDCCPIDNLKVYEGNHRWVYSGWQPGMVYEWVRDDNQIWVDSFPQWDH